MERPRSRWRTARASRPSARRDHDSRVGLLRGSRPPRRAAGSAPVSIYRRWGSQRVRQAEVALAQELVVERDIPAELLAATRERFVRRSEAGDVNVHEVRRAAQYPTAPIHPGLHRRAPPHQIALRGGLDKGETDAIAIARRGISQLARSGRRDIASRKVQPAYARRGQGSASTRRR